MSVHDLQAPREDRSTLVYPPLKAVGQLLEENRRRMAAVKTGILGKPFQELRTLARANVLTAAQEYLAAAGEPVPSFQGETLLVAGHQPELFHPGVWLKNFALCGLARAQGAHALNLIVDNDTAKNTLLNVPGDEHVTQLPFDHWQSEVPFEERHVLDEDLFHSLPRRAGPFTNRWNFTPLLHDFWKEACRQGDRTPLLGERFVAARRTFERRWNCANLEVPLSLVCQTEAFAWFACHLLDNLPRFFEVYNDVVRAYRLRYGIRSRHHPVPDLAREGDSLEAPLWAWRKGQKRRERLLVRRTASGFELRAGPEIWTTLPAPDRPTDLISQWQALETSGHKIRTRALTTTLFARLLLGDLFLHGLGGGKYDELTDEIIRRFYVMEPPAFMVLTGTLRLPFPTVSVEASQLGRLHTWQRDLQWNPQRHLDGSLPPARPLVDQKNDWIKRPTTSAAEKRERFESLRALTRQLRPFVEQEEEETRLAAEQTARALRSQQLRTRRDYAFCLYPEDLLREFFGQLLSNEDLP